MSDADLTNPIFTDEDAAWAHYEKLRWPDGAICPKCGSVGNAAKLEAKTTKRTRTLKDGTKKTVEWTRRGVHKCRDCGEQFSATVGTIFESSHIPMHKWMFATHLVCASKKGISAAQLHRMLGFGSYRTAWFMLHRIREAMAERGSLPKLGGEGSGGIVEADETYYGKVDEPSEADRGDCSGWLDIAGQLEAEGHAMAQHRLRADPILTHMLDVRCSQARDRNA